MSRTLNLGEHLLFHGSRLQALGANDHALRIFGKLSRLRDLPGRIAEQSRFRIAELLIARSDYAKARRHLSVALAHDPENAEFHYLMAYAHDLDPRGNRKLALTHYRLCLRYDPDNARFHCDAGSFALSQGASVEGGKWLHRAADLAPDDPQIMSDVILTFQEMGLTEDARDLAHSVRFRHGKDSRFQAIWHEYRFQELCQCQQEPEYLSNHRRPASRRSDVLPFLKLTIETPTGRKLVRRDGPSDLPPPRLGKRAKVPANRHA